MDRTYQIAIDMLGQERGYLYYAYTKEIVKMDISNKRGFDRNESEQGKNNYSQL